MKAIRCGKKIVSLEDIREITIVDSETIWVEYKDCTDIVSILTENTEATLEKIYDILREEA